MDYRAKLFPVTLLLVLAGCQSKNDRRDELDFKPLKDFAYTPATIAPGTEIELLALSGGKESDEETIYFWQFIGIDKSSGDTVRIISSLISVANSSDPNDKTYTTPMQYDPDKRITAADFYPADSSQKLAAEFGAAGSGDKQLTEDQIKKIMEGKSGRKEVIVINKGMDIFQRNYKTALGVLNFKQQPW